MLLLLGVVAGLVCGLFVGGRLANLGQITVRLSGVIFAALVVQIVIFSELPQEVLWLLDAAPALYIASLLVVVGVLWLNRSLPGVRLLLVGSLLNAIVITANAGQMPRHEPLSPEPAPGIVRGPFTNTRGIDANTRLVQLGDILELPFRPGYFFSAGDIAIAVGAGWFVVGAMRNRRFQAVEVTRR